MKVLNNRLLLSPASLVCLVSLVALLAAGWVVSDGVRLAISAPAALLLVGTLAKIFRSIDFTSPRLLNATTRQLAWIRIVVCLTALIYTLIENLPLLAAMPLEMQNGRKFSHLIHSFPGSAAFLASPYLLGTVQWTTAALLLLGLIGFRTRTTVFFGGLGFFGPGASSPLHLLVPFWSRSGLPDAPTALGSLRGRSPVVIPNFRYFLYSAFATSGRSNMIDRFLAHYVERRNRTLAFGTRITGLEIQIWRWNYVAEPNDPRQGWVTDVYPYDATPKPSSRP